MDSKPHLPRGLCVFIILINLEITSKGGTLKWSTIWWNFAAAGLNTCPQPHKLLWESVACCLLFPVCCRELVAAATAALGCCKVSQSKNILKCMVLSNAAFLWTPECIKSRFFNGEAYYAGGYLWDMLGLLSTKHSLYLKMKYTGD